MNPEQGQEPVTKLPITFAVMDDHREYCSQKWGYPKLADVLLLDLVNCFRENEKKHRCWNMTFKNYIRNNSPEGRFYQSDFWERCVQRAKQLDGHDRSRPRPVYDALNREPKTNTPSAAEHGLSALRKLREAL